MTHTTLLIVGAAVLTALLAMLVFGSEGSAEDERLREEQKLLRALEAQRRVRNAQRLRTERRRRPVTVPQAPTPVEPEPEPEADPEPAPVAAAKPVRREAGRQRKAERAERRAAAEENKRQEKARAAAEKAQREADAEARRRAEDERRAALEAARPHEAEEQAEPDPPEGVPAEETDKPLSELPLFSWANRIENEDRAQPPRRNT